MRLWEMLETNKKDNFTGSIASQSNDTLPGVYVTPELTNSDSYYQYRYGIALAAARAIENGDLEHHSFEQESPYAEKLIQVMFAPEQDKKTMDLANRLVGARSEQIASLNSREPKNINKVSPVAKPKRNQYGV